jgi:hypothetical protein
MLDIKEGQETFKHIHEVGDFVEHTKPKINTGISFPKHNHKYPEIEKGLSISQNKKLCT